jgi:hypothetical protein
MIMMKKYFLTLLILSFLWYSGVSQDTREYDEAIDRIVRKLQQYPGRTKELVNLKLYFEQANAKDTERITSLLSTGQPDIWYDIHNAYRKLESRQKVIMTLPAKTIQQTGIEFKDYQKQLDESKYKATAYLYAHGEKFMQSVRPEDARQAYIEFLRAAGLNNTYKNLDVNIRKAVLKGATDVEFEMHDRTGKPVSSVMIDQLSIIIWEFKKAKYGQVKPEQPDFSFAFILRVILDDIGIGSDQVKELQYQEERDIYQGSNVVDTIRCLVNETRQLKKAQLSGSLEYVDKQTGMVVNRIPIRVESVFSNAYATLQGDPAAAGDATRELLKSGRAAYPSSEQMILDATEEFVKKASEVILAE